MLMRRARLRLSERTAAYGIHACGDRFRNLRSKQILTPEDTQQRYAWTKKHRSKSASRWLQSVPIHLDNHAFKRAATGHGQKLLAKRTVRGAYRAKSRSLRPSFVHPQHFDDIARSAPLRALTPARPGCIWESELGDISRFRRSGS